MRGIITVLGKDRVGIMAQVCTYLADNQINILDISQTIVSGYFNMIMIADFSLATAAFECCVSELADIGKALGVNVTLQHEDIFNSMHKI